MIENIYVGIIGTSKEYKLLICEDIDDKKSYNYIEVDGLTGNQAIMLGLAEYIKKFPQKSKLCIYIPTNIGIMYMRKLEQGKSVKKWVNKEEGIILNTTIVEGEYKVEFINYGEDDPKKIGTTLKKSLKAKYKGTSQKNAHIYEPILSFDGKIYNENDLASTEVQLYVRGITNFKSEDRDSMYVSILSCKGVEKQISNKFKHSTPNRMILQGLIDSIELLKRPCKIKLFTHTMLGVTKYNKNRKGDNKDLLEKLFWEIQKGNHSMEVIIGDYQQDRLKEILENNK